MFKGLVGFSELISLVFWDVVVVDVEVGCLVLLFWFVGVEFVCVKGFVYGLVSCVGCSLLLVVVVFVEWVLE